MVELTDREKKIVLIKYIIHGVSPFQDIPIDTRGQMLEASLKTLGIDYNIEELMDLGEACLSLQEQQKQSLMGFLSANKDHVQRALQMIGKGNDRLKLG